MYLVSSTADYQIAGVNKPDFPIVLWEDMTSCRPANEFLRSYLSRGSIRSRRSRQPTGQAIYDFFGFIEAHGLQWDDVGRGEDKDLVSAYRDYCFDVQDLKRSTVRQRVLYVCAFYKFALRKGWIDKLPYAQEVRVARQGGFLAHVDASGGKKESASPMPRAIKGTIKYLTKDQAERLVSAPANPHHRMIISLALRSGLRREELATFPRSYVFDPDKTGATTRNIRIALDPTDGSGMRTKGGKPRTIYISRKLMKELHHYETHWRGERSSLTDEVRLPLFLNQDGDPWAAEGKGIEAMVKTVANRVGIAAHPHMLRHTYATHMLCSLQRSPGAKHIEPLVFIQRQLGHASVETTMVYLHLVNEIADEAVFAYADELDAIIEVLS